MINTTTNQPSLFTNLHRAHIYQDRQSITLCNVSSMTNNPKMSVTLEPKPSYSNGRQNNKGMCFSFLRKRSTNETVNEEMNDLPPVVEVTADNFHQVVIESEKDVLIEFYTKVRITNCLLLSYSPHALKSQRHTRR